MVLAVASRHVQMLQLMSHQERQDDAASCYIGSFVVLAKKEAMERYWKRRRITGRSLSVNPKNFMAELETQFHGDFHNDLQIEPAMFQELL